MCLLVTSIGLCMSMESLVQAVRPAESFVGMHIMLLTREDCSRAFLNPQQADEQCYLCCQAWLSGPYSATRCKSFHTNRVALPPPGYTPEVEGQDPCGCSGEQPVWGIPLAEKKVG